MNLLREKNYELVLINLTTGSISVNNDLCWVYGGAIRKRVFTLLQTANAQISLRIRSVWSGPSLFANRSIGHYRLYRKQTPGWDFAHARDESVHFSHAQIHLFTWRGPYFSEQFIWWGAMYSQENSKSLRNWPWLYFCQEKMETLNDVRLFCSHLLL